MWSKRVEGEREKMKVNGKSSHAKKIYDKSEKKAFFCRFQFGFETDENWIFSSLREQTGDAKTKKEFQFSKFYNFIASTYKLLCFSFFFLARRN